MTETELQTPLTEPETAETPLEAPDSPPNEQEDAAAVEQQDEEEEQGDEQLRREQQDAKAQTEAEVRRINDSLGREAQRHANRVVEIMGADADVLLACPLCLPLIPGFRYPPPPTGEQLAAVKDAIGEPVTPNYKPDQYSKVCDICDGLGGVLTGSKVGNQATLPCFKCDAKGWLPVGPERQGQQASPIASLLPPVTYTAPAVVTPDPPEVEALKALGYIVVPPVNMQEQVA